MILNWIHLGDREITAEYKDTKYRVQPSIYGWEAVIVKPRYKFLGRNLSHSHAKMLCETDVERKD